MSNIDSGCAEHVGCAQVMLQDGSVQPLSPALRGKANEVVNHMAEKALRCLAFAQKTDDLGALLLCTHTPVGSLSCLSGLHLECLSESQCIVLFWHHSYSNDSQSCASGLCTSSIATAAAAVH